VCRKSSLQGLGRAMFRRSEGLGYDVTASAVPIRVWRCHGFLKPSFPSSRLKGNLSRVPPTFWIESGSEPRSSLPLSNPNHIGTVLRAKPPVKSSPAASCGLVSVLWKDRNAMPLFRERTKRDVWKRYFQGNYHGMLLLFAKMILQQQTAFLTIEFMGIFY
jgi:hypothetical protein